MSRTSYIIQGDSPSVLRAITGPDTMGVIWRNAWSEQAVAYAETLVQKPELNCAGQRQIDLGALLANPRFGDGRKFREDLEMTKRLLRSVALEIGLGNTIYDGSRVEPAIGDAIANENAIVHVDTPPLIALSNPAGVPAKIMTRPVPGRYDRSHHFHPRDPDEMEAAMQPLPQNSILLMKGSSYPIEDEVDQGLGHCRDNQRLKLELHRARVVVHLLVT